MLYYGKNVSRGKVNFKTNGSILPAKIVVFAHPKVLLVDQFMKVTSHHLS
jgi:hypothetical protein